MSIKAVNQFLNKVSQDQELQAELAQALEVVENDRQVATELALQHGYKFTPEELGAEIANRQTKFQSKQQTIELSEEELEFIAGGACTPAAVSRVGAGHVAVCRW